MMLGLWLWSVVMGGAAPKTDAGVSSAHFEEEKPDLAKPRSKGKGKAKGKRKSKGRKGAKGRRRKGGKARQKQPDWSDPQWSVNPILNVSYVSVNGQSFAQAAGGLSVAMNTRYRHKPHWLSTTRGRAVGQYGLTSGSLGGDFRIGSFIGPDGKLIRLQSGPDFFYNGYGNPNSIDYQMQWTPGVDLRNMLLVKLAPEFQLVGEATPGWVFNQSRQATIVAPAHELSLFGGANIRLDQFHITVGYSKRWGQFGTTEGFVISGSL